MSQSLTRDDLADAITAETGCTRRDATAAVALLIERMALALTAGGRIELRDFGTFDRRITPPRHGRNPRTGEPIEIRGGYRVRFSAGKALRGRLAAEAAQLEAPGDG